MLQARSICTSTPHHKLDHIARSAEYRSQHRHSATWSRQDFRDSLATLPILDVPIGNEIRTSTGHVTPPALTASETRCSSVARSARSSCTQYCTQETSIADNHTNDKRTNGEFQNRNQHTDPYKKKLHKDKQCSNGGQTFRRIPTRTHRQSRYGLRSYMYLER